MKSSDYPPIEYLRNMVDRRTNASSDRPPVPLVYLDSNIFFRMHRGELAELRDILDQEISAGRLAIPFSSTHVEEAMGYTGENREEEISSTLDFISQLTRNLCLHSDVFTLDLRLENPHETRKTLLEGKPGFDPFRVLVDMINPDALVSGRSILGLSANELNNASPTEAVEAIDRVLLGDKVQKQLPPDAGVDLSFVGILDSVEDICRQQYSGMYASWGVDPKEVNFASNKFVIAFSLFDSFGFWPDKKSVLKKGSQFHDAQHGHFGALCGRVVSEDRRFRKKTAATSALLGFDVDIYSAKEAGERYRKGAL